MSALDEDLRQELGRHVRRLRTDQQLTLSALAQEIGISPSALSQIERGKSEPSLGTLWRLGRALHVSLFDFFAHDRSASVDVTRADERMLVEFDRFRYEAITRSARRKIDLFILRLEIGDAPVRDVVRHAGEEAGLVLSGSMDVLVGDARHCLAPGDGIWFASTEPHTFVNTGDVPCVSVWADTVPEADAQDSGWSGSLLVPEPPAPGPTRPRTRTSAATDSNRATKVSDMPSRSPDPARSARGVSGRAVPRRARRSQALAIAREIPVDTALLREIVDELSALGSRPDGFRVSGTLEDRRAAEIVGERMRDLGLRDVELEQARVDGWRLGACSLEVGDRVLHGASFGGAPGTPPSGIRAPLVDVGTGERRRLDRIDVNGRIALVDWHSLALAPAEVALELAHRGARGVVVACFAGGPLYQAPGAIGSFDSHWYDTAPPVLTIAGEDAAMLRGRLAGEETIGRLRVDVELSRDAAGVNVIGWLPGREPGPPIVIGAHHDAWFRGSFDNATGVAVMLAVADGLLRSGHQPRHTLCFTSRTGEEYGLAQAPFDWCVGAWQQIDVQHPDWRDSPFHLCLEASGHPGLRTIVEVPVELAGWARSVCRSASAEGWLTAGWRVGKPVTGTEQWPYLVSGVPGAASYAWETDFRRTVYHTPADTAAIVDFDHLARITRFDAALLLEADADPDAIHDHRARARHLQRAAGQLGEVGVPLREAAALHAQRQGRGVFQSIGRELHAVDARGETTYPHAQAAADLVHLDEGIQALERDDRRRAIKALEAVGSNALTRTLSAQAFAEHLTRRHPEAPRLSWAGASHLTATPDLWSELAALRGEPGSRDPSRWVTESLRRHRGRAECELNQRVADMTRALQTDPPENP